MDSIHQIEIIINIFLQSMGEWLILPMRFLSLLGQEEFFLAVLPLLYWCLDPGLGLRIAVMMVLTGQISSWLKIVFALPRPYWVDPRIKALSSEPSFGFPSGHAQNSAAIWGLMANLIRPSRLKWLLIGAIFLIGISRLYLGVHFFSDVVVGWLVGFLLVAAFLYLQQPVINWVQKAKLAHVLLAAVISSLLMVGITLAVCSLQAGWTAPADWKANALAGGEAPDPISPSGMIALAGTWLGLSVAGIWYYRTRGLPKTGRTIKIKVLRYLVGVVGVAIFWYGLGAIFPRNNDLVSYTLRYLRYGLVGAWVTAFAPLIFTRLGLD